MVSDKENNKEKKDQNLPKRGKNWERGFTIEENRVNEYLELYEIKDIIQAFLIHLYQPHMLRSGIHLTNKEA